MNQRRTRVTFFLALDEGSFGRYALVGLVGFGIDLAVFAGLYLAGIGAVPSTVVSSALGITVNYILNSTLNFKRQLSFFGLLRFFAVGVGGIGLSAGIIWLLVSGGVPGGVAKLISMVPVVLAQFLANKYWTFKVR